MVQIELPLASQKLPTFLCLWQEKMLYIIVILLLHNALWKKNPVNSTFGLYGQKFLNLFALEVDKIKRILIKERSN